MLAQQPMVTTTKKAVVAYEVLARVKTESGKIVTPNSSENAQVEWPLVDQAVAAYLPALMRLNKKDSPTSSFLYFINLSYDTLRSDRDFNTWHSLISLSAMQYPGQFVVEISEKVDEDLLDKRWPIMKRSNLLLGLDDYGSEQDHNALLLSFPWDCCKFEANRVVSGEDAGAVEYCAERKILSVIERVETEIDEAVCEVLNPTLMQGFRYGRPKIRFMQSGIRRVK